MSEHEKEAVMLLAMEVQKTSRERAALDRFNEAETAYVAGWREVEGSEPWLRIRQDVKDRKADYLEARKLAEDATQIAETFLYDKPEQEKVT